MKTLDLKTVPNSIVFFDHHLKNAMVSTEKSIMMFLQNYIKRCWNFHQPLRLNGKNKTNLDMFLQRKQDARTVVLSCINEG